MSGRKDSEKGEPMDGKGHPLPASDEARHEEIPEHLEREKGRGDDSRRRLQPEADPVDPEGRPYPYGDRKADRR